MTKLVVKFLAGKLMKKIIKKVILDVLRELASRSEETLDDIAVDALEEALK